MNLWWVIPTIRPEKAQILIRELMKRSKYPICATVNTEEEAKLLTCDLIVVGNPGKLTSCINMAVMEIEDYSHVYIIGDDCWPVKDTDELIEKHTLTDGVTYFYDGIEPHFSTHPIISKSVINELGYCFDPGYFNLAADCDLTEWAEQRGKYKVVNEIIIEHRHYSRGWGKEQENNRTARNHLKDDHNYFTRKWGKPCP